MKKFLSAFLAVLMVAFVFFSEFKINVSAKESFVGNTGKTYYVDFENGNDEFDGLSELSPWKTLEKVNNTFFEPGSAILLKRGCVWKDTFLWPKGTGSENNINYISCYGDENLDLPYISSIYNDDLLNLPETDTCVYLGKEQNYWDISNLRLYNSTNGSGTQYIINIQQSGTAPRMTGIKIHDCVLVGSNIENWSSISKSGLNGIYVSGKIDDVLIENNEISNVKAVGITVNGEIAGCNYKGEVNNNSAKGVVIRGNSLYNIGKDGILTNNCVEPLVEYNVCGKAHSYAKNTYHVAMWPFASYGSLFQYNEAYDTQTVNDGQGFDCDYQCYYTTFQYNYSHDNVGGFMLICTEPKNWDGGNSFNVGSTVRYNISQGDAYRIFSFTGGVEDTRIYNNTIYSSRNSCRVGMLFYSYSKGENILNKKSYPYKTLIANNIFWLDGMNGFDLDKSTETVIKNNIFAGRYYDIGPKDNTITSGKDSVGNNVNYYADIKDNLRGVDPLFVNGGYAEKGRSSCDVYKLYEGSPAIGKGIYIEDGFHKCPNDFYGNKIDKNSINIGAYQGIELKRNQYIYDEKYQKMIDFENDIVGERGLGESAERMSGISRVVDCTDTDDAYIDITDNSAAVNSKTNSKKCLRFINTSEETKVVESKFYVISEEMSGANGIRIFFNPNNSTQEFTVTMEVANGNSTVSYSKNITVSKPGYRIFTFNEKYSNSKNNRVTSEQMSLMKTISIKASLQPERSVYIDDIQVNKGNMDDIDDDTNSFLNESADVTMVEDFEETNLGENTNYGNTVSGPNGTPRGGSGICPNNTKAIYVTSSTSSKTVFSARFAYGNAFNNLRNALKNDKSSEGIQFNLYNVALINGIEISEDQKYLANERYNKCQFSFNSVELNYTKSNGDTVALSSFMNEEKLQLDSNNLCRIPFSSLYATVNDNGQTIKVYLTSFSQNDQQRWKENIKSLGINYTTIGADLGANVFQYSYLDNLAIYKNVQHESDDWIILSSATCSKDGLEVKYCKYCNEVIEKNVLKAKGHNYSDWDYIKQASCEDNGEREKTCFNCMNVVKEVVSATGHNYQQKTVKPTCLEDGFTAQICENCGDIKDKTNIIKVKGHSNTKWVIEKDATCEENGKLALLCTDCNKIIDTTISPASHNMETIIIKSTCTENGYTLHKCKNCNFEYKTEELKATGHIKSNDWIVVIKPTSFSEGFAIKKCTKCNEILETKTLERISSNSELIPILKKPKISNPKLSKGKATVKFKSILGATGYEINVLKNGKWKTFKTKKTKYVVKKLKKGVKYRIRVRAFVKKGTIINYSSFSKEKTFKAK